MTAQIGRRPSTTKSKITEAAIDLFTESGFDETSVDDVAAAAGIARRTLFRYYPSKNAIAWGDFDEHLQDMRRMLTELPPDMPVAEALQSALLAFNEVPTEHREHHRRRMRLLLGVPALQAHSMLMYTGWRNVVAEFVASRTGSDPSDLIPQTVAWTLLATALAAYEQWLDDPNADLEELLTQGSRILSLGLDDVLAPSAGSRQGTDASTGNLN
ncbi:mycofactocin system transcriptional regulator [Gordonia rubripertincta]|uniref:Mycofactocin system transcriptional regulator n=1 Tax=Gordonia rubripertincta TaxID=36822 RepID=A0ABT4N264_GORRU|nr:mycofactocin system transcriptional regulator [Gordonia rubripertincta]MCZ4553341.1 mycofactocin system transcriptional regulator [Gordonia rubripertincta]